jgi:deazaflavin-dependent oxidoreductase (nitroreductase family)
MVDFVKTRRRIANWPVKRLLGLGIPIPNTYLLTVEGRKTGERHTIPLTLVEYEGHRHLVGTRGEVNWVKNVRAAGQVTLSRGRGYEILNVTEIEPEHAAPVIQKFTSEVPFSGRIMNVSADAPLEEFVSAARRHPVFRLD